MSYLVLARKWRPQTFQDLIGQEHVSQTLKNAIETDRVAHAFLFTGARGVGKTSAARIFAKALNCVEGPTATPCNLCAACREVTAGNAVDVLEIDGASNNGVDEVRELRDNLKYLPAGSRYKIIIIDEVHMLSTSAFNALLKTLEEPPPHVKFIFATTEPHKVPITILSRCQRFDFKRISLPRLLQRLRYIMEQEGVQISEESLTLVARKGDGSMRDSLSTLDLVLAYCGTDVADEDVLHLLGVVDRRLIQEMTDGILHRDSAGPLAVVHKVDAFGSNMRQFAQELLQHLRNLLLVKAAGADVDLGELSDSELEVVRVQAAAASLMDIQRCVGILLKAEAEMAHATFPRYVLELAVVRMATLLPLLPIDEVLAKLKQPLLSGDQQRSPRQPPTPAPSRQQAPAPSPAPKADLLRPEAGIQDMNQKHAAPHQGKGELWPSFVHFVRSKKPLLAVILEKARPFRVERDLIEIGYPKGAFELSRLAESEVVAALTALAVSHFGTEPSIKIREIREGEEIVPSLEEKKSFDRAARSRELRENAAADPLVQEVISTFNAELLEVREPDGE